MDKITALLSLHSLSGYRFMLAIVGGGIVFIVSLLSWIGVLPPSFDWAANPIVLTGLATLGAGGVAGKFAKAHSVTDETHQLVKELIQEIAAMKAQAPKP